VADIKAKYPASNADTTALTITLASLASDTNLVIGRESTAIDNRTNLDIDHLLSGKITTGTSPTGGVIEVWVYAPISIASGTPIYPDVMDGTDSGETSVSVNVKISSMRLAWSTLVDTSSDRTYFLPPTSIASLFGAMPPFWGVFVVHSTGVNLNSNSSNQALHYHRIQQQTV
jgi:hypothetical protein